jgi:hypothetical protein
MYGLIDGWLVTILVSLGAVFMLVVAARLLAQPLRLGTTQFRCPWIGRMVTVRHLIGDDEEPTSVVSCSAFPDPLAVSCQTPCIERRLWKELTSAEDRAARG